MLLVDDLAAGGTKNLRHTPRGLVTLDLATHLNLFDWLFNHAFQRELYVELRCYT